MGVFFQTHVLYMELHMSPVALLRCCQQTERSSKGEELRTSEGLEADWSLGAKQLAMGRGSKDLGFRITFGRF